MVAAPTPARPALPTADADVERRALRQALLARRLALSVDEWSRLSRQVRAHLRAGFPELADMRLGFCWPYKQEPDLRPLIARWLAAARPGFKAALPVVIDDTAALAFRAWTPSTPMRIDRYGIPTPAAGEHIIPTALLIPANGFDAAGFRLGYGGGYFDRTLATWHPRPLAIGIAFELARLPSMHRRSHDQPLDAVVTEAGVFRPETEAGHECDGAI